MPTVKSRFGEQLGPTLLSIFLKGPSKNRTWFNSNKPWRVVISRKAKRHA